jgi:hypothetical protein
MPSNNEANKATKIYRLFTGALYLAEMSLSVPLIVPPKDYLSLLSKALNKLFR